MALLDGFAALGQSDPFPARVSDSIPSHMLCSQRNVNLKKGAESHAEE